MRQTDAFRRSSVKRGLIGKFADSTFGCSEQLVRWLRVFLAEVPFGNLRTDSAIHWPRGGQVIPGWEAILNIYSIAKLREPVTRK